MGERGLAWCGRSLPRLFWEPCFLARASSLWIRLSRYSCFLASISSVSLRRARASWGLGAERGREERVPRNNLPNLLMAGQWGARGPALGTGEPHTQQAALPGVNKLFRQVTPTPGISWPGSAPPSDGHPGGGRAARPAPRPAPQPSGSQGA